MFTPSCVFAVRQGRLSAITGNIIHPNGARSLPKVSVLVSFNSRPTVQLLTNRCCIVHAPVVTTHGPPLAPVFHLHSPSTVPATIRQPHLRSTFEHQHEAGQESAKPQHCRSGGTPYLGQVRGARVGAHSPLAVPSAVWGSLLGITCHPTAQGTSFYPNGHMPPTHICLALRWAPVPPQPSTPSTALCTQACSFLCKPPAPPPSKPTPWLFEFPGTTETNPRIPQPMSSPHPWCQSLCGGTHCPHGVRAPLE